MSLLSGFRAEQLLNKLSSESDVDSPGAKRVAEKLKSLGPGAIPKTIDALALSDKTRMMIYVDILSSQVNDKTLKYFKEGLADGGERVISGTAWALSSSNNFNPNSLLEFFDDPEVSKPALIEILRVHKHSLNVQELLRRAYDVEPKEKALLFNIIEEIATPELVPDLINRMGGKDPVVKIHLIRLLSRFESKRINQTLEKQLDTDNKMVRAAALNAIAKRKGNINVAKIASLLLDTDVDVQNKAVDVLINLNHPETISHLLPALKDESEYSRRAAVEVLNEIADQDSVKHLLDAIKDDDWWVRSRAGDALGEIGGPKVVNSVLSLINDKDEDIRRTAIEILNVTKDETAVDHLLKATEDSDWWVRERSVDALTQIGSTRAVPKLVSLLGNDEKMDTVLIRALGKLGDHNIIDNIVPLIASKKREVQIEAIKAIAHLADDVRAETVRTALKKIKQSNDKTLINAADAAIKEIDGRFSQSIIEENVRAERIAEQSKTLLVESVDVDSIIQAGQVQALDIATLEPGTVIDGRYKYLEKIGKGAFGTVLLMQDQVVEEQLILKFLNPNVSSDEEMMKRFVHELRYSRKITHRNVIRIYDFLHLQGCYAISMEYFPSHTLGGEIVDSKPMEFARALRFSLDMATGMAVAHHAGVIHRDLKPANILVNDDSLLKIVDFGVAAAASSGDTQLTKTGYVIGSPKYMAPEQILGKKVDETADIYSIGVIMYEMITGIPPYSRGDHMSVMYQHVQGKAKLCQEVNEKIPDDLAAIVTKCMSVDKTKRYQTMNELIDALTDVQL
ncbi:MAG: protein kinase [Woeseia sp.]|nr:HEAT repeat domain-containing protein [Woeseia sp.]MBT8095750.1 HEAT repeat domain-containing protein [Woeseia sp.]NNE60322.1 protein kinase [Woeseia sp.]NNL55787.1 protein kinase [Woeseia sp.]